MFKLPLLMVFLLFSSNLFAKSLEEIATPYFKANEYQRLVLNPNGQYIAAETYYDAKEHIEIIDTEAKKSYVIFNGTNGIKITIADVQWIDADSLIIQFDYPNSLKSKSLFKVLHLDIKKQFEVKSTFEFTSTGYIVDNLIEIENKIYLANFKSSANSSSGIYKVDLTDKEHLLDSLNFNKRIAKKIKGGVYFLLDDKNKIKFVMSLYKEKVYYWLKNKNRWLKTHWIDEKDDNRIVPFAINKDNQFVTIKIAENKDKKGVYVLDSKSLKIIKELYYSKEHDVVSARFNLETNQLQLVRAIKNGIMQDIFFDNQLAKAQNIIHQKYPTLSPLYISKTPNSKTMLFLLHSFQNEGTYAIVDLDKNKVFKVVEKAKWRKAISHATLETINFTSEDGFKIEAYISLPKDNKIKALLVEPHGGPIGVRSYAYFDSFSHFMAAYGIAVLKINYRGSSGFGKKFQEAGKKQWGNKIELDINDIVTQVIKKYAIREDKICAEGASYGGYSALMLHINYPQRYKCIVSMAGPTDLPLMFTSSDWNVDKESIKSMIEIVGNPHKDIEKLKNVSPLYNAKKIQAPVLLVHGTLDPRVNVEHSVRLNLILKKLGKPVKLELVKGAKHGFQLLDNQIFYTITVLEFINNSLNLNLLPKEDKKIENKTPENDNYFIQE